MLSYIGQNGLSLPSKEYYTEEGQSDIRQKYLTHIEKIFTLSQVKNASVKAKMGLDFETALAQNSLSSVEQRDVYRTYNKLNFNQFKSITTAFPWLSYCQSLGWPTGHCLGDGDVIVDNPDFLKFFNTLLKQFRAEDWRAYFEWQVLGSSAIYLDQEFQSQDFEFFGRTLSGQSEPSPVASFFWTKLILKSLAL
ncbi:hypothetical protein K7432_011116 [Basidiobolus ranarum]|uniref:Peptidase M13 N-terminal domain-containing protein n=1 Tax=Basidiobolus ranarum TaxID=34480 RepID=A0ABR2WMS0_9FUNG